MRTTTVAWAVIAFLVVFFDVLVFDRVFVLVIGVWLFVALFGLVLGIRGVFVAPRRVWTYVPFVVIALLIVLYPTLSNAGSAVAFHVHFAKHRDAYDAVVAGVASRQLPREGEYRGLRYMGDDAGRVAFPRRGIADNWEGVIYDPTGVVQRPEGSRTFGGDVLGCDHIRDAYYRCWFT